MTGVCRSKGCLRASSSTNGSPVATTWPQNEKEIGWTRCEAQGSGNPMALLKN